MRNSFVLYIQSYEMINELTTEQKGKLLETLFCYQMGKELPELDQITNIVFKSIKVYLDENNKKYAEKCERLKKNALKGGAPVGNKNAKKEEINKNNQIEPKTTKSTPKNNQIGGEYVYEYEYEYEYDNEKEKNIKKESPKKKYGTYKNVLLSDKQLDQLKKDFPTDWEQKIETLSEGIELKGYKYKNHLLAIKKWAKNDKKQIGVVNANTRQRSEYDNGGFFED